MEEHKKADRHEEKGESEYVLLDLDAVSGLIDIPPNAPYALLVVNELQGLDTMNPILIIDEKLKLIGEYEETIGSCFVFSEDKTSVAHEETGPPVSKSLSKQSMIDPNQTPRKQVKPVARLHKILKFGLLLDNDA